MAETLNEYGLPLRRRERQHDEGNAPELAVQEQARRVLARRRFLPFIMRNDPDFQAAWFHKIVCAELEKFSEAIANKESPRLIIMAPPRHGKSELVSRNFPSWHLGRYPDHEFIACSYGADLARDFSRKVRGMLVDSGYNTVFPDVELDPDSRSADRWNIEGHAGGYVAAGAGGPITGRGMNCLRGDTLVETEAGPIRIDTLVQLVDPPRVWSYNYSSEANELRPVQAGQLTYDDTLYDIETVSGRTVTATGEHRFFVHGRGYVQAKDLRSTDRFSTTDGGEVPHALRGVWGREKAEVEQTDVSQLLFRTAQSDDRHRLRVVRESSAEAGVRDKEDIKTWTLGRLLFAGMLESASRGKEYAQTLMCSVRDFSHWASEVLLEGMPCDRQPIAQQNAEPQAMSFLRQGIQPGSIKTDLLLQGVCERSSPRADDGSGEQSLQTRSLIHKGFSGHEARDSGAGWENLRYVWDKGENTQDSQSWRLSDKSAGSPHRSRSGEQPYCQSDYDVRAVPPTTPPLGADTVSRVTRRRVAPVPVFDIQVEGNNNFYANGILTHNCGVIDDYVKNAEEADSASSRDKLWKWYESTFKTRMAPGGGIIVMATRWHDDDLIGRILKDEGRIEDGGKWKVLEFAAEAIEDEYYEGERIRKKGEALHPERYSIEFFEQFKRNARVWWALFQQKPVQEEGGYFQEGNFKTYRSVERPPLDELHIISTWDFAVGQKENNDYTVGAIGGVDQNYRVWALDQFSGKWDSMETVEKIIEVYRLWEPDDWGFEHGQISLAIGPFLNRRLIEESIWDIDISDPEVAMKTGRRDKMLRARPLQGFIRTGHFLFPEEAAWYRKMLDEFLLFPQGEHDDQVDAWAWMAQKADQFITKGAKPKPKKLRGKWQRKTLEDRMAEFKKVGGAARGWLSS